MNAKDLLSAIGNDEHKIDLLSEIIDELLEECDEPGKYKNSFQCGYRILKEEGF